MVQFGLSDLDQENEAALIFGPKSWVNQRFVLLRKRTEPPASELPCAITCARVNFLVGREVTECKASFLYWLRSGEAR
jgi:hypothetical protein